MLDAGGSKERHIAICTSFRVLLGVQASGGDIGARAGARAPILPQWAHSRPWRALKGYLPAAAPARRDEGVDQLEDGALIGGR